MRTSLICMNMSKFGSRNHAFGSFGRIFQLSPPGKSTICSRQTSALKRRWFASSSSLGCAGSTSKASWHRSKTETKNRFKSKTSVDSSPFRPLANHQFPSISQNFRMKITILGGFLNFQTQLDPHHCLQNQLLRGQHQAKAQPAGYPSSCW